MEIPFRFICTNQLTESSDIGQSCFAEHVKHIVKIEKADNMRNSCEENGYTAVSMKNDWKTIYGESVTKI